MSITLTNITGASQTGLTTPSYTVTADTAPDSNGKQWAVTLLGGTQSGVTAHTLSCPFTVTFVRAKVLKNLPQPNPTTGVIAKVPKNTTKVITRKGVLPLAGQAYANMIITTIIETPAGADTADPNSVRAALSCHIGALSQQSAGLGDTVVNAVL